jgi:hypothetical protein
MIDYDTLMDIELDEYESQTEKDREDMEHAE